MMSKAHLMKIISYSEKIESHKKTPKTHLFLSVLSLIDLSDLSTVLPLPGSHDLKLIHSSVLPRLHYARLR